ASDGMNYQGDLSVCIGFVYPLEIELADRVFYPFFQSVGGIGKKHIAIASENGIVRAVEFFSLEIIRYRGKFRSRLIQGRVHDRKPPVAVLTKQQLPVAGQEQAVRAGFTSPRLASRISRRLQVGFQSGFL